MRERRDGCEKARGLLCFLCVNLKKQKDWVCPSLWTSSSFEMISCQGVKAAQQATQVTEVVDTKLTPCCSGV